MGYADVLRTGRGIAPAFKAGDNVRVASQDKVDAALTAGEWHDVRLLNTLNGYELWIDGDLDRWWRRPESTLRLGGFDGVLDYVRIIAVRN